VDFYSFALILLEEGCSPPPKDDFYYMFKIETVVLEKNYKM
jgi:hypothetical protein